MSLSPINTLKEQAITPQPLLLVQLTFPDATQAYFSTHPLNPTEGGVAYSGNNYLGRISKQDIGAIQQLSASGIDVPLTVKIHIEDPDRTIWQNYHLTKGFRSATVKLLFVYYDALLKEFSSDSIFRFVGTVASATLAGTTITLTANALVNMQRTFFPQVPIQQNCPWAFPVNAAQRADGQNNPYSPFWYCRYNGANTTCNRTKANCATNSNSGAFGGFTFQLPAGSWTRSYTTGQWQEIYNNNNLAKYGDWIPEAYGTGWLQPPIISAFGDGNSTRGECVLCVGPVNQILEVRVNDTVLPAANTPTLANLPIQKGQEIFRYNWLNNGGHLGAPNGDTPWNGNGDPYGNMAAIEWVVPIQVAGTSNPAVEVKAQFGQLPIPTSTNPADSASWPKSYTDNLVWMLLNFYIRAGFQYSQWNIQSFLDAAALADEIAADGSNNASQNDGYYQLNGTSVTPDRANGNDQKATITGSGLTVNNPIFTGGILNANVTLNLYIDQDATGGHATVSWGTAFGASVTGAALNTSANGRTTFQMQYDGSHWNAIAVNAGTTGGPRYHGTVILRNRISAADLTLGLRRAMNAIVYQSPTDGLYHLMIKGPLGQQQGSPVDGSNFNTPIVSCALNGNALNGYVAYKFDSTNIIRENDNSGVRFEERSNSDIPNAATVSFIDSLSDYATSSVTVVETDDLARGSAPNTVNMNAIGVGSYAHAFRVGNTFVSEGLRGNPNVDCSGTLYPYWRTTAKGIKLNVGQIVLVNDPDLGSPASPLISGSDGSTIPGTLVRILKIDLAADGETMVIHGQYHVDAIYRDDWSKLKANGYAANRRDALARPPLPWGPFLTQTQAASPALSGELYDKTIYGFQVQPNPNQASDGSYLIDMWITGYEPVNTFSALGPPVLVNQGTTANTGGTIPGSGTRVYVYITALDSTGLETQVSNCCIVDVSQAGSTNTVTVKVFNWPTGATGYRVYAGVNPNTAWQQYSDQAQTILDGTGTPASITVWGLITEGRNMPDVKTKLLRAKARVVEHCGPFGVQVSSVSANTIVLGGNDTTGTNNLVGYDLSVLYKADGSAVPMQNFRITAQASPNTFTVNPDPVAAGLAAFDVMVLRSVWSYTAPSTIRDPAWQNQISNNGLGLNTNEEAGRLLVGIAGPNNGHVYTIDQNDATGIAIRGNFYATPTSADRFIICDPLWITDAATNPFKGTDPTKPIQIKLPCANYAGRVLYIKVFSEDSDGSESVETISPFREVYIIGQALLVQIVTAGTTTLSPTAQVVLADTSAGPVTLNLLASSAVKGRRLSIKKISSDSNALTIQPHSTESIG